ncbi:MAG: EAL domain-containing protein [Oleiphilaceae bacterium]|nr:EAL domain-containing protein [Oleiphilaceae bacterium]
MSEHTLPTLEMHVVCVDDDREFLHSLGLLLPDRLNTLREDNSWLRFSFFESPNEALAFLKEMQEINEEVAMIVSDQKMPLMKGTEFLARAREYAPLAARVLLTGYAGIESAVEAINEKLLDRYLTKPIDDESGFALTLHQMIEKYRLERTIERQGNSLKELYGFANTLNSIEDFQAALDYIVLFTSKALQCERVSLMLLKNEGAPHLVIAAAKGLPEEVVRSTRLSVGDRVAGTVFQNRQAIYARSVEDLDVIEASPEGVDAEFLSVPMLWANLKSSESPVGVLNATEKANGQVFNQNDLEILTYISNTATISINNHLTAQKLKEAYIESKTQAAALTHIMHHNALTGLPNRTDFDNKVRRLVRARSAIQSLTVLMINLDRFRDINCAIGHESGDIVIKMIANRLASMLEKQPLFHIGTDEFAILLENVGEAETLSLISTIQQRMARPIELEGNPISIHMTYGIAVYPEHAADFKLLMQKADVALNQAKQLGKNVHIYDGDKDLYNSRRLSMMNELRRAISADELVLFYQPKVDLRSGNVEGVEALVRWIHPIHGFTPPDQFIPLAEQTGLMEDLTDWVLRQAAQQCADWSARNVGGGLSVAVNLSTLNLLEAGFAHKVKTICSEAGTHPAQLHLEITESVIMGNIDMTLGALEQLHKMGFRIDLDDFGTGYSSLSYVKNLPVDAIKIDRSFIKDIDQDEHDVQIVQSIIELGHSLNLKLIAEGAENQEAVDMLRRLGCDSVQGYFFSRPVAAADFEAWLLAFNGGNRSE